MKFINYFLITIIRFYKYSFSPFFPFSCRYLPTCSEYFIDCVKLHGTFKGFLLGIKRILRCHPIKILGGSNGFDPAPVARKKVKK